MHCPVYLCNKGSWEPADFMAHTYMIGALFQKESVKTQTSLNRTQCSQRHYFDFTNAQPLRICIQK